MTAQPPFPLARTMAWLSLVTLSVGVLVIPLASVAFGHPAGAIQAAGLMVLSVWIASLISLIPTAQMARFGQQQMMMGYLMGSAIRFGLPLVVLALAIKGLELPTGPAAVGLVVTYLPVMFVEAALAGRHIRQ